MELTWYGHASIRIVTNEGTVIYIDPYAGEDAWYDKSADIVLITHHHYDHLKETLLHKVAVDSTVVLSTSQVRARHNEVRPVWPGERHEIYKIKIMVVEAYNIGKPNHLKGEGLGFVLEIDGKTIYIAGDTDFIPEMRKVKTDIVVLPVSGVYTMNARQAADVVLGMKPKVAIPYHWGSGIVGSRDDAEMFKEIIDNAGITTVHILVPNQSITL